MATNRDGLDVALAGEPDGDGMSQVVADSLADRINRDFGNLSAYVFRKSSERRWLVGVIGIFEDFESHEQYEQWFENMLRDGDDYQMGRHAAG